MAEFLEEDLTCMRERCVEYAHRVDELADQCQGLLIVADLARRALAQRRASGIPLTQVELSLGRALGFVDGEEAEQPRPI